MRVRVDQAADAVYLILTDEPIKDSTEVADGIVVDYDDKGRFVAVEILGASKAADDPEVLREFSFELPNEDDEDDRDDADQDSGDEDDDEEEITEQPEDDDSPPEEPPPQEPPGTCGECGGKRRVEVTCAYCGGSGTDPGPGQDEDTPCPGCGRSRTQTIPCPSCSR